MATKKEAPTSCSWLHVTNDDTRRSLGSESTPFERKAPTYGVTFSYFAEYHPKITLRRHQRLRHRKDFEALRNSFVSRAHPLIILRASPNMLEYSRIGFVVSRRVTPKAVVRNRIRRRLREAIRQVPVKPGWDLLLIARAMIIETDFETISRVVFEIARRANLVWSD